MRKKVYREFYGFEKKGNLGKKILKNLNIVKIFTLKMSKNFLSLLQATHLNSTLKKC